MHPNLMIHTESNVGTLNVGTLKSLRMRIFLLVFQWTVCGVSGVCGVHVHTAVMVDFEEEEDYAITLNLCSVVKAV